MRTRVAALLLALLLCAPAQAANNILLLIADDFGVDAASFYPAAARIQTTPPPPAAPNLKKLAAKGVLFRNAEANPNCSPSRATILTGRYAFRTGIGDPIDPSRKTPPLPEKEVTLPEAIARANPAYRLAHLGKWHLGPAIDSPNRQGWPLFSGPHPNLGRLPDFYDWPKVVNGKESGSRVYATTDTVNDALAFIKGAEAADKPWFAWVAFNAPHDPYHLPPLNLHTRDALPDDPKAIARQPRPYFEAEVEAMDSEIGRLLKAIDLKTTTVIFVGDNGTSTSVVAKPIPTAHAKWSAYEPGIHVPLLVAGAGVSGAGRMSDALVNTVDLFPTILGLAGAAVPAGVKVDGVDMLPLLRNAQASVRPWAYSERFPSKWNQKYVRAIRDGRYKLIAQSSGEQLFDLSQDPLEKTNLLAKGLSAPQQAAYDALRGQLAGLLKTR